MITITRSIPVEHFSKYNTLVYQFGGRWVYTSYTARPSPHLSTTVVSVQFDEVEQANMMEREFERQTTPIVEKRATKWSLTKRKIALLSKRVKTAIMNAFR